MMIVGLFSIFILFCILLGIRFYMIGYKEGYIDGKLDEKWRMRDARNDEFNTNK